jgi:hypothetical protein
MNLMIKVVSALVALALVFGLGWLVGRRTEPLQYETIHATAIMDYPHGVVGILPAGTVVLANYRLAQVSDAGSVACVPMLFGSIPAETESLVHLRSSNAGRYNIPSATSLASSGLHPNARFDIEGPSVIKPSAQAQGGASKVP